MTKIKTVTYLFLRFVQHILSRPEMLKTLENERYVIRDIILERVPPSS